MHSHKCVQNIDNALSTDYHTLMDITELTNESELVKPGIEMKLLTKHAQLKADVENESEDDPEHVSASIRENVTRVELSEILMRTCGLHLTGVPEAMKIL